MTLSTALGDPVCDTGVALRMGGSSLSANFSLGIVAELGVASDKRLDLGITNVLSIEEPDPLESEFLRRFSTALRVVHGFDMAVTVASV